MDVTIASASVLVDRFEELLLEYGISIPRHPQTGADMLPLWMILERLRTGFAGTPDDLRQNYTAGVAVHDLAAKMLEVHQHPQFVDLVPHLKMLADGAIHLTEVPPAYPDAYNKLIELYWAGLCLGAGLTLELDHPTNADGKNPDVVTRAALRDARHGYALKTVRSPHTQSMLEHLEKGIRQIEGSASTKGIVAFHLTPRLQQAHEIWPEGGYFSDWLVPMRVVSEACRQMIARIMIDNGQSKIDELFRGTKTAGSILCLAFSPTVAVHPVTGNPVVMHLKVGTVVQVTTENPVSNALGTELTVLNHMMQTVLG